MAGKKGQPHLTFRQIEIIAIKEVYYSRNDSLELIGSSKAILLTQYGSTGYY
jgi:hypothetical protein